MSSFQSIPSRADQNREFLRSFEAHRSTLCVATIHEARRDARRLLLTGDYTALGIHTATAPETGETQFYVDPFEHGAIEIIGAGSVI